MKLCKDCKHLESFSIIDPVSGETTVSLGGICQRTVDLGADPITGASWEFSMGLDARHERRGGTYSPPLKPDAVVPLCGPDAQFFEPKP